MCESVSLNLIPLVNESPRLMLLNTLLFVPFGFLAPRLFKLKTLKKMVFVSLAIIVLIELAQMLFVGRLFDIDDLLFNILGAVIGYGLFHMCERIKKRNILIETRERGVGSFSLIAAIAAVVIGLFLCFSNYIFAVTFDESFAKAIGLHTKTFNTILSILTAVIIVFGMRIMGTLLISSIIIFPALTSMKLFNNFKKVVWSSAIISALCFIIAFFAFYQYSSAASIVIVNLVAFIIATIVGKIIRRFSKK
jgi:hypothetical protein